MSTKTTKTTARRERTMRDVANERRQTTAAALLQDANNDPQRAASIQDAEQDQTPIDDAAITAALDASDAQYNAIDAAERAALGKVVVLLDATTARPDAEVDAEMAQIRQDADAARAAIEITPDAPAPTPEQTPARKITRAEHKAKNKLDHAAARLAEAMAYHAAAQAEYDAIRIAAELNHAIAHMPTPAAK